MNQTKTRLQSLGLLDRTFKATTDDELTAIVAALDDEHRDAARELVGSDDLDADSIREAIAKGRLDGTMESIAVVLTDACLADCIKELGEHADNPSSDQLREVLPGIIERHGLPCTRIMLASTVVGEASAAAIIRDLLKNDDTREAAAGRAAAGGRCIPRSRRRTQPSERRSRRGARNSS